MVYGRNVLILRLKNPCPPSCSCGWFKTLVIQALPLRLCFTFLFSPVHFLSVVLFHLFHLRLDCNLSLPRNWSPSLSSCWWILLCSMVLHLIWLCLAVQTDGPTSLLPFISVVCCWCMASKKSCMFFRSFFIDGHHIFFVESLFIATVSRCLMWTSFRIFSFPAFGKWSYVLKKSNRDIYRIWERTWKYFPDHFQQKLTWN